MVMFKIKLSGIYQIYNKNTEEYYIGMSSDIFSRWANHYNDIKINKHTSTKLVKLWLNSNITDWEFKILEVVSKTQHKIDTGLKGKAFDKSFRNLLLKKEKEHMSKWSKTYALNKNNRYFS
jgi:excinuclease UvrABC nuclease subunit